jgi:GNAT superfamily N-acetyltransferase
MIEIKQAIIENIEELAVLFDKYRVFYKKTSDLMGAKEFLKARIANQESTIFIATKEDTLIGFVQLYPIFSSTRMKRLYLLNDLFVDTDFRGQGISVALIEEAKNFCRQKQACGLVLETAKTNDVGNNLYPKLGFSLDNDYNHYSWNY